MLTEIDNTIKYGKQRSGFGIEILYPGLIRPALEDSGFSTIGRIDHARIAPGTLIPMHPHKNDEILTYLRSGRTFSTGSVLGFACYVQCQPLEENSRESKDYLLQIRSNIWLMDLLLEKGQQIVLPKAPAESCGNLHR